MDREHLFNPENAPDAALDEALTERAGLWFGRNIAWIDKQTYQTREGCHQAYFHLVGLENNLQRISSSRKREQIGELQYARQSIDVTGQKDRQRAIRRWHGSNLSPEARQKKYAEAEGRGRNRALTELGGVRWYEDHRASFEALKEGLDQRLEAFDNGLLAATKAA